MGPQKRYKKAKKGTVSLQELSDRRRFKYRYQSKPYFLTLPSHYKLPHVKEEHIRRTIEMDIHSGTHDNTQERYKKMLQPVAKGVVEKSDPVELYDMLNDYLLKTGRSLDKNLYFYTYRMVVNWGNGVSIDMIPQLLEAEKYSPATFNDRKLVMKSFCDWLLRNGKIGVNPLFETPAAKRGKLKDSKKRRLSDKEINSFLEAIRTDRFVNEKSYRFKHSTYYSIFYFLAFTGVRPAEAIGLQVKKVNLRKRIITIDQALARTRAGTSAGNRVMKGTKMEDGRDLPYKRNSTIHSLLVDQCKGKSPDSLVFTSPTGRACDDRKMNEILKFVLKKLNIEERVVYVFRHSFVTRCFEQGLDVKTVQALTGHRDVTVLLSIYAEVTQKKVVLPGL